MTSKFRVKNGLAVGTVDIVNSAGEWIGPAISGNVYISGTAPSNPVSGDLWWDSSNTNLYIYYDDGNSAQWVEASPSGGGSGGGVTVGGSPAPVDNQLAVWTSSSAIEGDSNLTWDGSQMTVTGDIEANDFIGQLRGPVSFRAQASETLAAGDVVYISGVSGQTPTVGKADADDAAKMPAFGLVTDATTSGNPCTIVTFGTFSGYDTSTPGWSVGDTLYVSTTAGAITNSAPAGESAFIQNIGTVQRVDSSAGRIKVGGAGRTNATPNLNEGRLFVGNASNQAVADGTMHIDIANSRVGIGTTTPARELDVVGGFNSTYNTNLYTFSAGVNAGRYNQAQSAIAIGGYAGNQTQGANAIAIGADAARYYQGVRSVAIGAYAASGNTGSPNNAQNADAIAIGYASGRYDQGTFSVAMGSNAGNTNQGDYSVVIGGYAGSSNQGVNSVAIGYTAGQTSQSSQATAIGTQAGQDTQSTGALAIGWRAGRVTQGQSAIAMTNNAGEFDQGNYAIAMGPSAGRYDQGIGAIAIGQNAGTGTSGSPNIGQGYYAIAIGGNAGNSGQSQDAIAIGRLSGNSSQGQNSIALGYLAGQTSQASGGIIINATGSALDDTTAGHIHIESSAAALDYDGTDWSMYSKGASAANFEFKAGNAVNSTNIVLDSDYTSSTNHYVFWKTGGSAYAYMAGLSGSEPRLRFTVYDSNGSNPKELLNLVGGGTRRILVNQDSQIGWRDTSGDSWSTGTTADTGIARDSAGVLKVTDGSTGSGDLIIGNLETTGTDVHLNSDDTSSVFIHSGSQGAGANLYLAGSGTVGTASTSVSYNGIAIRQPNYYGWTSGTDINTSADLTLYRDAANTLAQRNSTNAQVFNIYNTYTDASNYERGFLKWNSNVLEIGTEAAGTGTVRNISFAGADVTIEGNLTVQGTTTTVDSTVVQVVDPIFQIGGGAGGAALTVNDSKDRGMSAKYFDDSTSPGSEKTAFWGYDNSTGYWTFIPDATISSEVVSGTKGTLDVGPINAAGNIVQTSGNFTANNDIILNGAAAANINWGSGYQRIGRLGNPAFAMLIQPGSSLNHTLAIANGTNAQTLQIYNTFTDASNYERGIVGWDTNYLKIGSEAAGTGTARNTSLIFGGAEKLRVNTNSIMTVDLRPFSTSGAYDLGLPEAQWNDINAAGSAYFYNTYTDASNYERGIVSWDTNEFIIGTEAAGTGTQREIKLNYTTTIDGGNRTNNYALTIENCGAGNGGLIIQRTGGGSLAVGNGLDRNQIDALDIANKALLYRQRGSGGVGAGTYPAHQFINDSTSAGVYPAVLGVKSAASGPDLFHAQNSSDDVVFSIGYGGETTIAGSELTSSNTEDYALSISQTLNATTAVSGTQEYRGIKFNLTETDTTGWDSVYLMDLQVGGTSAMAVGKNGYLTLLNSGTASIRGMYNNSMYVSGDWRVQGDIWINRSDAIKWDAAGWPSSNGTDLVLERDASNTLAQRNGTNAQEFRLYNTYTDASNYERGFMKWNSDVLEIGTEAAGTGSNRNLRLNPAGGSVLFPAGQGNTKILSYSTGTRIIADTGLWLSGYNGGLYFQVGNNKNINAAGGTITASTTDDYAMSITQTLNLGTANSGAQFRALKVNVTETDTTGWDDVYLMDLQVGGTSKVSVDNAGLLEASKIFGGAVTQGTNATNGIRGQLTSEGLYIRNTNFVGWSSASVMSSQSSSTIDTRLYRDGAAATLALRNGTNAQSFRIYNTYTDASNYERGAVEWDTNTFVISSQAAGTGTARPLVFDINGTEAARFDDAGDFGIGTTNPVYKLHVLGTGTLARFQGTSSSLDLTSTSISGGTYLGIGAQTSYLLLSSANSNVLTRATGYTSFADNSGNEWMRITNAGDVGIGTNSPGYKLEVAGSTFVDGDLFFASDGAGANWMKFERIGGNTWRWNTSGVGEILTVVGNLVTIPQNVKIQRGGLSVERSLLSASPALGITETWNSSGTTFTAIKTSITDTASAADSKLIDLQIDGVTNLSMGKSVSGGEGLRIGDGSATGGSSWPYLTFNTTWGDIEFSSWGGRLILSGTPFSEFISSGNVAATPSHYIGIAGTNGVVNASLFSDASNQFDQRNSTNAQTFNIYNTYTDASNYERGFMKWDGNILKIGTEAAGTGTSRDVQLGTVSGTTVRLGLSWLTATSTTISANRSLSVSGGVSISDTWNDGATTFTGILQNVTDTASAAASLLMDLQVGGSSKFKVDKTGFITATRFSTTNGALIHNNNGSYLQLGTSYLYTDSGNNGYFGFGPSSPTSKIHITETWNDGATTFTGILQNVTDTASAAASLLMDLQVAASSKFKVDKSGNATAAGNVTAYSDARLKDNVETLPGDAVLKMRGVSFTKDGKAGSGVIAQELEQIAPELVDSTGEYKSVAYGNLVGYLIEAVKMQEERIRELEKKLEDK